MEFGCYTNEIATQASFINIKHQPIMYSITAQLLSLEEAKRKFKGIIDFDSSLQTSEDGALAGMECWLPSPHETDATPIYVLFLALPGVERAELRSLASQELWQINGDSENLLRQESFVVLGPQEGGIYLPLWGSRTLAMNGDVGTIRFVLAGDEWVLDACHHLTGMDLEHFLIGCQAVMGSSGPHYNPCRAHGEDCLAEVAQCSDEIAVTGQVVHIFDGR